MRVTEIEVVTQLAECVAPKPKARKWEPEFVDGPAPYVRIPLSNGTHIALVDAADLPAVVGFKWHLQPTKSGKINYAACNLPKSLAKTYGVRIKDTPLQKGRDRRTQMTRTSLHQILMGRRDNLLVDHINGDGLDCRRSNLRWATQAGNSANARKLKTAASKYKGVSWSRRDRKWWAQIWLKGKPLWLGSFDNEHDAARAYNDAALALRGEFARLNEIPTAA